MKKSTIKSETVPEPCTQCALRCYQHETQVRIPLQVVKNVEPGVFSQRMLNRCIDLCVAQQLKILLMAPIPFQN